MKAALSGFQVCTNTWQCTREADTGSADRSAADRWARVVVGHIDAATTPAVGCHDEVQVRAAAQGDKLTARANILFDHFGCRPVQLADLSVKQQCEWSGLREHADLFWWGKTLATDAFSSYSQP